MLLFFVPQVEDEVDDIAKAEFEKFEQTLKESGKPTWCEIPREILYIVYLEGALKGLFNRSYSFKCIE